MGTASQVITADNPSFNNELVDNGYQTCLLWSYHLTYEIPNEIYENATNRLQDNKDIESRKLLLERNIQIQSSADALKILSYIAAKAPRTTDATPFDETGPNNHTSKQVTFSLQSWDAILRAIDNQLMIMYLIQMNKSFAGSVQVHLNVSKASEFCSPKALGRAIPLRLIPTNSKNSKKTPRFYALILLEALAELFDDSLIRDVADSIFKKSTAPSLNSINYAHEIYNRIDNMHNDEVIQYSSNENNNSAVIDIERLPIHGLVPTLRPYQEAAVRWMINREAMDSTASYNNSNEWEVLWMVFSFHGTNSESHLQANLCLNATVTLSPLYEYMKKSNRNDTGILLYSPFGGWITSSYTQAKDFSLNTVEAMSPRKGGFGILAESMGLGK